MHLARAAQDADTRPLLKLVATLDSDEELIVVEPGGRASQTPIPCYAVKILPETTPGLPAGVEASGTSPSLVLGVAEEGPLLGHAEHQGGRG